MLGREGQQQWAAALLVLALLVVSSGRHAAAAGPGLLRAGAWGAPDTVVLVEPGQRTAGTLQGLRKMTLLDALLDPNVTMLALTRSVCVCGWVGCHHVIGCAVSGEPASPLHALPASTAQCCCLLALTSPAAPCPHQQLLGRPRVHAVHHRAGTGDQQVGAGDAEGHRVCVDAAQRLNGV
jgi:hypothetical protein